MSDVFVSYARTDWPVANALVEELRARGYEVWWDRELHAGREFHDQIREQLDRARATVVIWSEASARSPWVLGEAQRSLQSGKLLSTRFPDFRLVQIPSIFQAHHIELVDDVAKIEAALADLGIQPKIESASIPQLKKSGDRVGTTLRSHIQNATKQVSFFLPIIMLIIMMFIGIGLALVANAIGIGVVPWRPKGAASADLIKEVGYLSAINWSLASVILFPFAWALVMLAAETLSDIKRLMVRNRMIVTTSFEPITAQDHRFNKLFRDVRRMISALISIVMVLIISFSVHDYLAVVNTIYMDTDIARDFNNIGFGAKTPLDHHELERDWSVAAFLDRSDDRRVNPNSNSMFALVVYLMYPGLGVGMMFSFYMFLVGIGMFFMPRAASQYGLLILPNLESKDERRGFEIFSELFGNALSITGLCFCCSYLMLLQNVYLRVEAPTLLNFVIPNFTATADALALGQYAAALDHLIGNTFAPGVPYGAIQSVLAWFIIAFMFMSLFGIAYLFLRASALRGRNILMEEVDKYGMSGLLKLSDLPEEEVRDRLASMKAWPLSWPKLNQMMWWYGIIFSGLVFYKLGLLFVITTVLFAGYNTFRSTQS